MLKRREARRGVLRQLLPDRDLFWVSVLYQILILALVLARILREIKETSIESFQLYFVYDLKLLGRLGVLPDWSGVVPTGLLAEFAGFLETGNG